MKNKLEYRIENGSLIIDNYFNNLKIGSINGGSVENILNKCKLYDEEYGTLLKENEYMKHIAKDFEQLQQENKKLNGAIQTYDILLKANAEENKQLQERIEYLERSNNRREDIIIEQRQEINNLEDNWDELKKYLHNVDVVVDYSENYDGHFINYDELIDKMQELERGVSDER